MSAVDLWGSDWFEKEAHDVKMLLQRAEQTIIELVFEEGSLEYSLKLEFETETVLDKNLKWKQPEIRILN